LRLCGCCFSSSSSSRRSALLRSRGYYFFSGSGRRLCAPLRSRGWHSNCAMSSSKVGAGLRLSAGSPTVSHSPSSLASTGSVGGTSWRQGRLLISKYTRTTGTRLH
jgi:hypothetical protein